VIVAVREPTGRVVSSSAYAVTTTRAEPDPETARDTSTDSLTGS
jgi:hypothetical protein